MTLENEPPQPAGHLEFSGEEEIYDDGVFRISLPAELIPQVVEDALSFEIDGFPFRILWTTGVLEGPDLETLECPSETLEDVIRFFIPDLLPEDTLRPVSLANGFSLGSHGCVREGERRNCCLLASFADDDAVVLATLEVAAPEEWQNDRHFVFLLHLLKKSIRSVRCTIGEPTINTSKALLHVPKIGIRFPLMLGSMVYRFATDYDPQAAGSRQ